MEKNQVPWLERISYGLSDTGFNLMFTMMSTYLLYFYTDVFGVAAALIAPVFLAGRIIDGFTDPFEGILMDRVHTRWGRSRPFWLWFSIPWAILAVLVFSAPDLPDSGKIVYIYITYLAFNAALSLVSLPISAILPSLTSNTQERTVINVVRMVFNVLGNLIVVAVTLSLVQALGGSNLRQGYLLTAILFSSIAVLLFMNAFARTRERVRPVEEKPVPVKTALKSVLNLPWFLLMILVIIVNLSLTIKNMSTIYYMEYNLNRPDLTSAMLTVPNLVLLVAIVLSPFISKRMGKRNASLLGVGIGIAGSAVVAFSGDNIPLLFGGTMITFLGLGLPAGLLGAMFADTVDFIEWKTGVRSQGLIYSASSIGIKIGQGLGGALGAGLLALGNYVPNVTQAASSLAAIQFSFAWVILISLALLEILLIFYNVDRLYPQITTGLEERRSRAEAPGQVSVK